MTTNADLVRNALRPSESVKTILDARQLERPSEGTVNGSASSTNAGPESSRILAIVTNSGRGSEEGSIFVFKRKLRSQVVPELSLLSTNPILGDFSVSIAQFNNRSSSIDVRSTNVSTSRSEITVTIYTNSRQLSFSTASIEELKSFINECKRLQQLSNRSSVIRYPWLNHYNDSTLFPNRAIPSLTPPPDLRTLIKPVHAQLSPASAGQPGDEDSDIILIRDDWIRKALYSREVGYAQRNSIRIRVGTFNVNGKNPSQDLSQWLRPQSTTSTPNNEQTLLPPLKPVSPLSIPKSEDEHGSDAETQAQSDNKHDPDVIVLGFQELDLSTEALLYSYTTTKEDLWVESVFAGLGEVREQYVKMASQQLVGMLIILIVKKALVPTISDIRTCSVGTGIMRLMGNKGATALRFIVSSTTLTFVNSHLAAFDEMTARRNADFHDLSRRLSFTTPVTSDSNTDLADGDITSASAGECVYESDVLFWLGDLNYRIDLSDSDVRSLISKKPENIEFRDALQHDQLRKALREAHAFQGFKEGPIKHLPTYRFGSGLMTDSLGYDLKRRPAWTDRILHLTTKLTEVRQISYSGHPEITFSDHRPVSATFDVEIRKVDTSAYENIAATLFKELGDFEDSEEMPKIKVSYTNIELGEVYYRRRITRDVELRNVGAITCAYRFVSLSSGRPIHPPWLLVEPLTGLILPGETSIIRLTAYVDNKSASSLNTGPERLEERLILHSERGKDHFITVNGKYQRTCFATDLSWLVRLPSPVRTSQNKDLYPEHMALSAPREIMRLINWMMSHVTVPGLFLADTGAFLVGSIRECLDTGNEFSLDESVEIAQIVLAFGETLLRFLDSLPSPVVPASIHARCIGATSRDEAFEIMMADFPPSSVNVWISLTAFLHYVGQQPLVGSQNEDGHTSRAESLACVFAPILLRDNPNEAAPVSPISKRRFLLYFIS